MAFNSGALEAQDDAGGQAAGSLRVMLIPEERQLIMMNEAESTQRVGWSGAEKDVRGSPIGMPYQAGVSASAASHLHKAFPLSPVGLLKAAGLIFANVHCC